MPMAAWPDINHRPRHHEFMMSMISTEEPKIRNETIVTQRMLWAKAEMRNASMSMSFLADRSTNRRDLASEASVCRL